MTESMTESVTEYVTESMTESTTESMTESRTESVTESLTESTGTKLYKGPEMPERRHQKRGQTCRNAAANQGARDAVTPPPDKGLERTERRRQTWGREDRYTAGREGRTTAGRGGRN